MSNEEDRPVEETSKKSEKDDRMMAMFCHLGGLLGSILVPLIIWLIKKEDSKFIDYHGKEAINFQLTMLIAHVIAGVTICFTFGAINMVVWVLTLVFSIIAAMEANKGEKYRYPMCIRFIS